MDVRGTSCKSVSTLGYTTAEFFNFRNIVSILNYSASSVYNEKAKGQLCGNKRGFFPGIASNIQKCVAKEMKKLHV